MVDAEVPGRPGKCCGHLLWGRLGGPDAAHLQFSGGRWGRRVCVQLDISQGYQDGLQLLSFWRGRAWLGAQGRGGTTKGVWELGPARMVGGAGRGWARTAGFGGWAGNAGPTRRPPGPRVRSEQDWSSYCRPGPVGAPSTSEGSPSVRSGSKAGITVRDSTGTSRGSPPSTNIMCLRAEPFRRIWWEIFWGQEHSRLGP